MNEIAQAHIRSMRMAAGEIDLFSCEPHNDLLSERSWNEAYCTADPGAAYAVFFPDGGNVLLDVSDAEGRALAVRWLEIRACRWAEESRGEPEGGGRFLRLATPAEEGYWAAVVTVS